MRTLKIVLFALLTTAAVPAFGQSPDSETRSASEFQRDVLRAIDVVPTREQLDASYADAARLLRNAATNGELSVYQRHRAISLLSLYPDASTRDFLEGLSEHEDDETAARAVYTLARTFGVNADARLVAFVEQRTKSDRAEVREWAVRSLRWVNHPKALEILRRVAASDDKKTAPVAKRALRKHVRRAASSR